MQKQIALIIGLIDTFRSFHPDFKCLLKQYLKLETTLQIESTYGLAEIINAIMNVTPEDRATIKTLHSLTNIDDYVTQIFHMTELSPEELERLQRLMMLFQPFWEPEFNPFENKTSSCEELYLSIQSMPRHAIHALNKFDMLFTHANIL